jgi:hypothetical protein
VQYELEEIKAAIAFDREVAGNVGWLSLIKTPGNRKRLRLAIAIVVFSQWSGNGLMWVRMLSRKRHNSDSSLIYSAYCKLASSMYGMNAHAYNDRFEQGPRCNWK